MLIDDASTAVISAVPAPPIFAQAAPDPPLAKHASTSCCAERPPRPPGDIASVRSISYQSAENLKRSNVSTMPNVVVSAVSGSSAGLPPEVFRYVSGALPFHGLLMPPGKPPGAPVSVTRGRKSSRKPAARTSRDSVPRSRTRSLASYHSDAFQLVKSLLEDSGPVKLVASFRVQRAAKFVCSDSSRGTSISPYPSRASISPPRSRPQVRK